MSKFAIAADHKIEKHVFDFQLAETGSFITNDQCYWIVDVNSNQAIGFSLLDDLEKICMSMNEDQSWGPFEPCQLMRYTLI